MNSQFPHLQTANLTLSPLEPGDAITLFHIYQSEGVLRYFPNPGTLTLEKLERFVTAQQAHWARHGYGNWGLHLADRQEIIGWAGLQYLPELDQTEVGFLLDRPFWGKGFATEAAAASLRFGFEQCHLEQIIALVHPDNLASRRVIAKCGLAYVDTLHLWGIDLMRFQTGSSSV
jgi:ribosomal-protein-alanine N-acetyltransferase